MPGSVMAASRGASSQLGGAMTTFTRNVVLACELEVALVMRGDAHDGARAIGVQHVVGGPDLDAVAGQTVDAVRAGEHAGLRALRRLALDLGRARGSIEVRLDLGAAVFGRELPHERVLWRQHHKGHAAERVGARSEDADLVGPVRRGRLEGERHLGALGAADPVALHQLHVVGPVERLVVEQFVGILRRTQEPLLHQALDDGRVAALAAAVDHLFVGEDGLVERAPVRGRLGAVSEAHSEQLDEPPLRPPVVLGRRGVDLAVPVEHRAHALELSAHALDVRHRPVVGVQPAAFDGRVLGRQAEGVEADGEEHVVPAHAAVARQRIGGRHREPVPDVQVPRGVREHRQRVPVVAVRDAVSGAIQA